MRDYMPGKHRAFLQALEKAPSIADYVRRADVIAQHADVVTAYNQCVAEMAAFRNRHIQMVSTYIVAMAARTQCGSALATRGTGGAFCFNV
jgi:indoleamine 2,3-dioxygenase